jgi:hypothetical protein
VAAAPANNAGNTGGTPQFTVPHAEDRPAPENAAQQGEEDKKPPGAAEPTGEETFGGATIINAGAAEKTATQDARSPSQPVARPAPSEPDAGRALDQPNRDSSPERTADENLLARCAKRYSSFRASDGTYQPYDGGPRKLCSLLR